MEASIAQLVATVATVAAQVKPAESKDPITKALGQLDAASSSSPPIKDTRSSGVFASLAAAVGHQGAGVSALESDKKPVLAHPIHSEEDDLLDDPDVRDGNDDTDVVESLEAPIAKLVAAKVARFHGSFAAWLSKQEIKSSRNRHEMRTLCTALDLLLMEGANIQWRGIETLVRRLQGLHLVEQGKSWSVAKALQQEDEDNLLPRSTLRHALKEAALVDKLEKVGKEFKSSSSSSSFKSKFAGAGGNSFQSKSGKFGGGRGAGRGSGDSNMYRGGSVPSATGRGGATPAN